MNELSKEAILKIVSEQGIKSDDFFNMLSRIQSVLNILNKELNSNYEVKVEQIKNSICLNFIGNSTECAKALKRKYSNLTNEQINWTMFDDIVHLINPEIAYRIYVKHKDCISEL